MAWLDTVTKFFRRQTTGQVAALARGASGEATVPPGAPSAMFGDSGMRGAYQQLATMLSVDSDLMLRYADYENMDDYEILCLSGGSLVFTLDRGWVPIRDLAACSEAFWVLAYDRATRSLVPAQAMNARRTGAVGHGKPMVRVVLDDGHSIECTADHQFLTKDEQWVRAKDLQPHMRLMPGVVRMRPLNTEASGIYWEVHQPQADSQVRGTRRSRWTWVHRLVGELVLGGGSDNVVHHRDSNGLNSAPDNLSIESISSHASHHIAHLDNSRYFPAWTPELRAQMGERMRGNTYRRGTTCTDEQRARMSAARAGRPKSEEWRRKIGLSQPNRIEISQERLEAAIREGGTVAGAARILGVSYSKARRAARQADLLDSAANHRVLRVVPLEDRPEVFDIEVPGYHNFVCNGVVVHNSAALDVYADSATIEDTVHHKVVWALSKDKIVRDIINDLLDRRIRIEEDIWNAVRTLVKYGDLYSEVVVNEKGVLGLNWLPSPTVRRIVDAHGVLIGFVQDPRGAFERQIVTMADVDRLREQGGDASGMVVFKPWEVTHWRLRGKRMSGLYGHCERKTAKVTTTTGVKEIQYLQPGDVVQAFDGFGLKPVTVLDVVCNGKKKVFSIKTRHRENFATAEHPVCVFDPHSGFGYKPVQDLRRGDQLVVPRPLEFAGRRVLIKAKERFTRVRLTAAGIEAIRVARSGVRYFFEQEGVNALAIPEVDRFCAGDVSIDSADFERLRTVLPCLQIEGSAVFHSRGRENFVCCPEYVDEDFAWLFGLILGDGWTSQGRDVGIAVGLDETFNERIVEAVRKYGLDPHPRFQTVIDEESGSEERVLRQYIVHSKDFVDLLYDLGFIQGAHNKRIPQWVYESPRPIREAVLRGFVDADGWDVNQHGQDCIRIEVCNYDLSRDLKTLIDGLGWTCGNVCVRQARVGKVSGHPAMRGRIVNSGPGYILHFHTTPLFDGAVRLEQVISVMEQPTEAEDVYDIQVDSECHNFVADGMVVHNSLLDSIRWVWKRLVMLEDNSLAMKLLKAPARFAFYVDTGEVPPREAKAQVDEVRRRYKKKKIVDPATGKLDFRVNPMEMCLSLETRIPLLNGTIRTLQDLIADHEAGVQNYVYSMDPETKHVKPGKISWAGVTRRNAQVLRVTLDNCQEVIATPDHQFLMRDGKYKEAQLLEPGDSVMPLYRGIDNKGYGYVVNQDHRERGLDKWEALRYLHRLVAESYLGDPSGMIVHHVNEQKRNNYPDNLEVVTPSEHGLRHAGALAKRVRQWNKDHPGALSQRNRARNSGRHIIEYNSSPKHKADNAIRSAKISIKYPDGLLPELRRLVQANPTLRMRDALIAIHGSLLFGEQSALNPNRKRTVFGLHNLRTFLQHNGYPDWRSFCEAATENHKVVGVEWLLDVQDTGCITVDVWHNFALDAGIFVKNSEDFFIPTRGGRESTRVEVLSGPDYDETGVLGYFQKKLYAGLRIPPQYLGGTEVTNRAALTQEDVAFARLTGRIQREFLKGLRQVVRVHLAALNIDPDSVQWDLQMPVPSAIFEMQQLEVWNSRAGLAMAIQPFFTNPWILANIFHMSEEDALFASEAKQHEAETQAIAQASVQADIMQRFPELGPEGALALGAPQQMGGMGMAQGGAPVEAVQQRVERALTEVQRTNDRVLQSLAQTDVTVGRVAKRMRIAGQTRGGPI